MSSWQHITKLYKPGTTQVCEIKQAKRLRDLIKGEWDAPHEIHQTHLPGLEKVERELLLSVLDQWVEILEEEVVEPCPGCGDPTGPCPNCECVRP